MFRDELASLPRPSLDGMAQEVLARGRRARRVRAVKIASTALVAIGLAGAAIQAPLVGGHSTAGHSVAMDRGRAAKTPSKTPAKAPAKTRVTPGGGSSAGSEAVILATVKPEASYIPQPSGPKAPTTPAAVLDQLLKLLPAGATSNYAFYGLGAQTYLNGAYGLGMIRIFLYGGSLNPRACTNTLPSDMMRSCSTLPSGATVLINRISDNCIEPLSIDVDHGDGTVVQVDVASCLAWNGHSNPPTRMAITADQAEQIAANPAWGAGQMDAALVHDAAIRFPDVPQGS